MKFKVGDLVIYNMDLPDEWIPVNFGFKDTLIVSAAHCKNSKVSPHKGTAKVDLYELKNTVTGLIVAIGDDGRPEMDYFFADHELRFLSPVEAARYRIKNEI